MSMYPLVRPRRLRRTARIRQLVRETRLEASQLVLPLFVVPGTGVSRPVPSMPGVSQWSVDRVAEEAGRAFDAGVRSVILFGIPEEKDAQGSDAWRDDGIVQQALAELRKKLPELLLITDVCLCEYTDHGHCGVLQGEEVLNDPTLDLLAREAVSHARAGADIVAPSDMMDGRVAAIRDALDDHGFEDLPILSYAVKYASGFYGPFRDAADSAPSVGDRRGYQMDPANRREAQRELALDLEEGADMVMVKPAGPNLDILADVRASCDVPVAAYQVSGEYAMIKAAAERGWLDEARVREESLVAIRRAGADLILTYFAIDQALALREG
ncbi:MAG: porphobilinogen synthase [Candidatus Binatia bacterium]|nr:porphobilinogen synthase [Candidatus Binatia bacterium]MDG2011564.1 porphobilinogen synthase [Candidatus Binatia bacterium]